MFEFLRKNNAVELYSPVVGKSLKLENVSDPVFSEKMLGDGLAFTFDGDTIYSPCNGEIVMIAATKHAIGILSKETEVLIHVGLETVELNGKGFELFITNHTKVKRGQPLMKINRRLMKDNNIDLTTMMIVTSKNISLINNEQGPVNLKTKVIMTS